MTDIVPGQLWADNDPRSQGRVIQIVSFVDDGTKARVMTIRNSRTAINDNIGRTSTVNLAMFKKMEGKARGFRMVQDHEGKPVEGQDLFGLMNPGSRRG